MGFGSANHLSHGWGERLGKQGVLGKEAAYKGSTITWDAISKSDLDYMPEKLELGAMDMKAPLFQLEVPGKEQK